MTKERNRTARLLGGMLSDPTFKVLDERFSAPNLLSMFKMDYNEKNYSSLLAYFLNPNENHGLEDQFLRAFISSAIAASATEEKPEDNSLPSPIPYDAVNEVILDWDQLDVLSADLRETMVATDFPLGDYGNTVDICIWNDSYNFVIYVENIINTRYGWRRYFGNDSHTKKSLSNEYVLDLYKMWASEESGMDYQILPVFLTLGESKPSEKYITKVMGYEWMINVFKSLLRVPSITDHAKMLAEDFVEHLIREFPAYDEDEKLKTGLKMITDLYGEAISKLHEHVIECRGCDSEDELIVAYHDIYRRHKATVDAIWMYMDSQDYSVLDGIYKEIEDFKYDDALVLNRKSSLIVGINEKWGESSDTKSGSQTGFPAEVYFSASSNVCGIFIYQQPMKGRINRLWLTAQDLAEEHELELSGRTPTSRNFHLIKKHYEKINSLEIARDFIKFYKFLDDLLKELK